MKQINLEYKSGISLKLQMIFNDVVLSYGTGYFEKFDEKYYLVSNYHVFSGRDPFTDKPLDKNSAIPNKIRIGFHDAKNLMDLKIVERDLYDANDMSLYKIHTIHGTDVAVLPFDMDGSIDMRSVTGIERLSTTDIDIYPPQKVTVVGFPFGFSLAGCFPIWKTGNIASEVVFRHRGDGFCLIDAATRGGMSGSPVYAIVDTAYQYGGGKVTNFGPTREIFMGTYSGRLNIPKELLSTLGLADQALLAQFGSDIGLCWYDHITIQIINHGKYRPIF